MSDYVAKEISDAIRATVGAPLAEFGELIADKIRYQRWKNAVRTLERAADFAKQRSISLPQPDLKFFLPFMEGCSLEEGKGGLVDEWARLLTNSSQSSSSNDLIFIRILREIGPLEARVMKQIATDRSDEEKPRDNVFEAIGAFSEQDEIESIVFRAVKGQFLEGTTDDLLKAWPSIVQKMQVDIASPGSDVLDLSLWDIDEKFKPSEMIYQKEDTLFGEIGEIETLAATDVLAYHRLVEVNSHVVSLAAFVEDSHPPAMDFLGVSVTSLGAHFIQSCMGTIDEN